MARPPRIAIAFFPKDGFAELRAAQVDAISIPLTWGEWYQRLQAGLAAQNIRMKDCIVVRLKLENFRSFCQSKGRQMDLQSRAEFAVAVASGALPAD